MHAARGKSIQLLSCRCPCIMYWYSCLTCCRCSCARAQVLQEDAPLPPAGEFSEEFRDFVRVSLQKDPHKRPMAEQLLTHPFITKVGMHSPVPNCLAGTSYIKLCMRCWPCAQYAADPVSLKAFMQCAFNPHDKLDEIAIVFAFNYYALLNAGVQRLRDLAPLYSPKSVGRVGRRGRVSYNACIIEARRSPCE